jgi:hypothetical protein
MSKPSTRQTRPRLCMLDSSHLLRRRRSHIVARSLSSACVPKVPKWELNAFTQAQSIV